MSDPQGSTNSASGSSTPTRNIPSMEEVERIRANRPKQIPTFFKSKRALATEEENTSKKPQQSPAITSASVTPMASTTALTFNPAARPSSSISPTANLQNNTRSTSSPPINNNIARLPNSALPAGFKRTTGNTILVNPTQQKNPILKHVHNVPWEPSDAIKMDYVVGQTTGVVYLSLRYHRLYPTYIYDRLSSLKNLYVGRILLVYVDVENYHDAIREINRIAILSDFTLMLAWSPEEAGRYLETYKAFENKGPDLIRERVEDKFLAKMTDCLTSVKSVNKTDVLTLLSTFGSLKQVAEAKADQLAMCPGFGEQKVKRLQEVWKQPFLANKKQKR